MPNREAVAQLISAGGSWLPGVAKYHVTLEDLDSENSNRDETGVLHRDIIRSNVIHAQVTHIVDQAELTAICGSIKEDATVQMTLFCPGRDESEPYVAAEFYVSKVDYDLIRYKDPGTGDVADWWQLNYTLVEV
jgi:hypothetical protein